LFEMVARAVAFAASAVTPDCMALLLLVG
jgi:hypothetical protein